KDMLIAADPFFRGMDLSYGPDGAVYVLDWSDTGECHEHTGVHRTSGRIYRVSYGQKSAADPIVGDLRRLAASQLIQFMTAKNEWYARQARLILAERTQAGKPLSASIVADLNGMLAKGRVEHALRALSVLYVTDSIGADELALLVSGHESEHVRTSALRLLSDTWPLDDVFGPTYMDAGTRARVLRETKTYMNILVQTAKSDSSPKVQLALASILQRLPLPLRAELASNIMSHPEFQGDHNLPLIVWYGLMPLGETHPKDLADSAIACRWPKIQRLAVRRLTEEIDSHPSELALVLEKASDFDAAAKRAVLMGLADGLKGWGRAEAPASWREFSEAIRKLDDSKLNAMLTDLSVVFGDGRAIDYVRKTVMDDSAEINLRRSALKTFVASQDPRLAEVCLPLLSDPRLNTMAAKGVANSNDVKTANALVKNYRRFRGPNRPSVIEILVSRPLFAKVLLDAVRAGQIPAADLTAFDVRQIKSLGQSQLTSTVAELWGNVRETSEARQHQIDLLKAKLTTSTLQKASAAKGRTLFNKSCSKCHRMFGYGEMIGPDLTGANRTNLDYLLENIIAPSSVVSKDYRMTIVIMNSGQVFNGLVTSRNSKTLTLQTQTELKTIALLDIEETIQTTKSPMPDGLLDNLSSEQIRDLVWYLMQPAQVEAELE
ncbi:MAG: hypothetical protein ABJZ55_21675, partial [Fuerstiella sp.]